MTRKDLIDNFQFTFKILPTSTVPSLFNDNIFVCTCNAPVWIKPYTNMSISVPFLYNNYCINFYTDLESKMSKSEKDYMYAWIFQVGKTDLNQLIPVLNFLTSWYEKDDDRPEVVTILPRPLSSSLFTTIEAESEYVYYTTDIIDLKRPGLSGTRQGIRRYTRDRDKYRTVTLKDYINNGGSFNVLHDYITSWYETKAREGRLEGYPFFEVTYELVRSMDFLLQSKDLNFNGILVFDKQLDKLIALSFASVIKPDHWMCLNRLADGYYCLSSYLFAETAKLYMQYKYCNDGSSSGIPGLAKFKQSLMSENIDSPMFYSVVPIDSKVTLKELL